MLEQPVRPRFVRSSLIRGPNLDLAVLHANLERRLGRSCGAADELAIEFESAPVTGADELVPFKSAGAEGTAEM